MTIREFLADKSNILAMDDLLIVRKDIQLNNGVVINVGASEFFMCIPRNNLFDGSYEAVEMLSSREIKHFSDYRVKMTVEPEYGYVPIDVLESYIKYAGGIKCILKERWDYKNKIEL